MEGFAEYLRNGSGPVYAAAFEAWESLFEASEGDARRYLRAALERAGVAGEMRETFGDEWCGEAYRKIRDYFVRRGGCDVYFVPGIGRIVYGSPELVYSPDIGLWYDLREIVRFISIAHKGDFTRNLEQITTVREGPQKGMRVKGRPLGFRQLKDMFGTEMENATAAERAAFERSGKTPTGYEILELKDFEEAHKYLPYTNPASPWCYLETPEAFEGYRADGNRLYLALKPGFEGLKPGDPGYGRSMIGFDMGPVDENGESDLMVCSNRYNHGDDLEGENSRSGDSKYTEQELAEILGIPIWKDCPGYSDDELIAMGHVNRRILERQFGDFDSLYTACREDREKLKERYGIEVSGRYLETASPFVFSSTKTQTIICYAVVERGTGKVTFFDAYQRLPGADRLGITRNGDGVNMVDNNGRLLCDRWYFCFNTADSCNFPIPVARRDGLDYLEWNLVDKDGRILYPRWYAGIQAVHAGIVPIETESGIWRICDVADGKPVDGLGEMHSIRYTPVHQCAMYSLHGADGKYNYLFAPRGGDWRLLLPEWSPVNLKLSELYRKVEEAL